MHTRTPGILLVGLVAGVFFLVRTATAQFVPSMTPVGLLVPLSAMVAMLATRQPLRDLFTWVLTLAAIPVVVRLMLVGESWGVQHAGTSAAGALLGMYVLAGTRLRRPPSEKPALVQGPWQEMITRANDAHRALLSELKTHALAAPVRQQLTEQSGNLLLKVERAALSWSRLERNANAGLEEQIKVQMDSITALAEGSSDDVAAQEYGRTREALSSQLEAIRRIKRNSERALARARSQVTLMETARLSVMAYASQDEEARSDEAQRLAQMLSAASEELDITAGALEEARGT